MSLVTEVFAWTLLALGVVLGVAGVILPVLPGPLLLVLAAIAHKLMLPQHLSWGMIVALGVLAVLERLADFAGTIAGAKWMGASRWGLIGAVVGGVFGIFFLPIGIFVGPILGAFLGEFLVAKRQTRESARAGFGAGVGAGVSTVVRLMIALFMALLLLLDLVFFGAGRAPSSFEDGDAPAAVEPPRL